MRSRLFAFAIAFIPFVASAPVAAAEIESASRIDSVTVYPDGASVTRVIRADLPAGVSTLLIPDFPLTLDPSSLRVQGEGNASFVIGAVDARRPRPAPPENLPEIDRRIEALRDQRAALDGAIAAANARRKFAERFAEASPAGLGEKGEARPLSEWRDAFAAVGEEVAAADAAVREAKIKQRDIDREIAKLAADRHANPPQKMQVRIDLNASAPASALLRVTYTVRGARWTPIYDARLDTGGKDRKPALELVRRAEITQNTGEDWADVALEVSTVRTGKGGNAPELPPLLVRFPEPPRAESMVAPAAPAPAAQFRRKMQAESALESRADEQEAVVDTGGFQAVFKIPGRISVAAGAGSKSFRIASATITPELLVRAAPALDETAFLEASFKHAEDAPLLPGRVSIYRDGVFVGRSAMTLTPKDETLRLGFGADEKVKVERTVTRRTEGTAGIVGSSKTEEREFKITFRNGHDAPIKVAIEDQVPVSESEEIKIELLPVTTPPTTRDVRDRRGVMQWAFEARPGETREIKLGWRVRWPKDKAIQFVPRPL
jgi:uncharacterized protein (TIGR02231 family)